MAYLRRGLAEVGVTWNSAGVGVCIFRLVVVSDQMVRLFGCQTQWLYASLGSKGAIGLRLNHSGPCAMLVVPLVL